MDKPLITVVTATYNIIKAGRSEYIKQCIESVHNQTYDNIEHIVIDGASDDGTLDILKEYEEKGWIKVYSEPDNGIYYAMNKGIDKANGKYIVFLNSDDFWHNNKGVEESIKALEENNADFSYATANYIDENEKFIGYLKPIIESFMVRMPFSHQTMFTKTERMRELDKFNTKYRSAADYDFVIKLITNGAKGVEVNLNFTTFRYTGFSADNSLGDEECIKILTNSHKKLGIESLNYAERWYTNEIPKNYAEAVLNIINPELKEKVLKSKTNWIENNNYYKLKTPTIAKIKIIFDANILADDSNDSKTEEFYAAYCILKELHKMENFDIYLYYDHTNRKKISKILDKKEDFSNIKQFWGNIANFDIFFSPQSEIPDEIKKTGIPCFILRYGDYSNSEETANTYNIICNKELINKNTENPYLDSLVKELKSSFENLPYNLNIQNLFLQTEKKTKFGFIISLFGLIPLYKKVKNKLKEKQ